MSDPISDWAQARLAASTERAFRSAKTETMTQRFLPAFTGEEIMAIHTENARLRAALRQIIGIELQEFGTDYEEIEQAQRIAREALNEQSPREGTLTPEIEEWAAKALKGV